MQLLEILLRWLHVVVDSKSPGRTIWRTLLGAFLGGLLGVVIPVGFGLLATCGDDDPTAGSGYGMLVMFTLPVGLFIGGYLGALLSMPND